MLYVNEYKKELLNYVNEKKELFIKFDGLKLVITGAAGLIGSYIADLFLTANEELNILVKVYLIDKNIELLGKRFADKSEGITCICCDVNCEDLNIPEVDYIIHAASNTSPVDYAMNPVSTIHTNVIATDRLIRFSLDKNVKRFLFCSSVEAYGISVVEMAKNCNINYKNGVNTVTYFSLILFND